MGWEEYNSKRFVKKVNTDNNLIKSLIQPSENKFESNKRLELNETTASTKISIAYESLRELLEAYAIKKVFKIYNHEYFCAFLTEICNEEFLSSDFNKFRKVRNQINYYWKKVLIEEAKIIINEIILLKNKIRGKLK